MLYLGENSLRCWLSRTIDETQDILGSSYGAQLSVAKADVELTFTREQYLLIIEESQGLQT